MFTTKLINRFHYFTVISNFTFLWKLGEFLLVFTTSISYFHMVSLIFFLLCTHCTYCSVRIIIYKCLKFIENGNFSKKHKKKVLIKKNIDSQLKKKHLVEVVYLWYGM